jgi:hypothetical protein
MSAPLVDGFKGSPYDHYQVASKRINRCFGTLFLSAQVRDTCILLMLDPPRLVYWV